MAEEKINAALVEYCLRYGDSSLILGHRLSEWCGHGPILEEDIAMINIALDLIGQSRTWLQYAAELEGKGRSEDDLAYLRDPKDFKNFILTEQPNGDFAVTLVRQFFYTAFAYNFYKELTQSKNSNLAAIAEKSLKEVSYHLRHCSEWLVRLGDGTEESHERTVKALNQLYPFTSEFFEMDDVDQLLIQQGIGVDLKALKPKWNAMVEEVFEKATLQIPSSKEISSFKGKHTNHLTELLEEMQVIPRTYPGTSW